MKQERLDSFNSGRLAKLGEQKRVGKLDEKGEKWESTHLVVRQDDKGTATRRLYDNGEKFGIHGAERRVPRRFGDSNIIVALLALQRRSVHVAKLAGTHHAERHVCCTYFQSQNVRESGRRERR